MYSEQVSEIKDILKSDSTLSDVKGVYEGDNQNIPIYPAVTIDLTSRSKRRAGMGVKETACSFNIWVYINNPDYTTALDQLEGLTDRVETVLQKDPTLNDVVRKSNVFDDAEFGVADRGGTFLQTARIPFETTSKLHK